MIAVLTDHHVGGSFIRIWLGLVGYNVGSITFHSRIRDKYLLHDFLNARIRQRSTCLYLNPSI